MHNGPVAIIDIGSNSIKVLVASRRADRTIESLYVETIDARISAGISQAQPRLAPEGQERGVAAISQLLATAARYSPRSILLVATSAVRDAENGEEFRERVRVATGHPIRILSGDEEANLIGRGLTCDPALAGLNDFYLFDLGGGSLECLSFTQRRIQQAISLPLGCVRLTEKFVRDANAPIPPGELDFIRSHTQKSITDAGFRFDLPATATAVATGGTVATVRSALANADQKSFDALPSRIELTRFHALLSQLAPLTLPERKAVPGIPVGRADVFPAALATLIAVADLGRFVAYQHSFYNLRFGLADENLG